MIRKGSHIPRNSGWYVGSFFVGRWNMSAIWGMVDFSENRVSEDDNVRMQDGFCEFKIDKYSSKVIHSAFMGCGLQYIKIWSENEVLPKYDGDDQILFTVDGVVDNREEVLNKLGIADEHCPDGDIIYEAFKKWGGMLSKYIYGSYAYAAFNVEKNELFLGGDHVASRALYYQRVGSKLYFATRMDTIVYASKERAVNEEWLALFIGMNTLAINTSPTTTPFKGVMRVEAFHYNRITKESLESIKYWDYNDIKPIKLKNDDEYKKYFLKLYEKCVTETVAGINGEPGLMLSGGFDSTTVGAFLAKGMQKEGKNVYGYSHVPLENSNNKIKMMYTVNDESEAILQFCEMYPNVKPNFMSTPECDGFSNMREILATYETPYKSHTNIDWVKEIYKKAGESNHRILLNGQYGNASVSYGMIGEYISHLIASNKLVKAMTVSNTYCKKMRYSRKLYLQHVWQRIKAKKTIDLNYLDMSVLDVAFAKSLGITEKDKRLKVNAVQGNGVESHIFAHQRKAAVDPIAFAHIADAETAFSLKNGIVVRDPTKDIRIIELCSAIPIECFVNDKGQTRRLVRHYCKDLLPTSFFPETAARGIQSSDWFDRVSKNWDSVFCDIKRVLDLPEVAKFVKKDYLENYVDLLEKIENTEEYRMKLLNLGAIYLIGIFIEKHT